MLQSTIASSTPYLESYRRRTLEYVEGDRRIAEMDVDALEKEVLKAEREKRVRRPW